MNATSEEMVLRPIGLVRSALHSASDARDETLRQQPARLEIMPEFADAMEGLKPDAEILVLFWLHRLEPGERQVLRVHPQGNRDRPKRGVFATRSPARPNPIAVTSVRLVDCEPTALVVEGLDALDGSPILDIKIGG